MEAQLTMNEVAQAKEQLLNTLENSRNYTLQVAEAMPADQYMFKLQGAGWNFGELLHHIAYGIEWWEQNHVKGNAVDWNPRLTNYEKTALIAYLNQAYASLRETITTLPLTDQYRQGFYATLDHVTHHRGQAVLYLRCHGITPPEYTY